MHVLWPWLLGGLASLPVLALIYLLSRRSRILPVSFLRLWPEGSRPPSRGRIRHRQPFPPIFYLELLILTLLTLAAAGPWWADARRLPPLTLILDDSYSMQAGGDDSALRRAKRELAQLARRAPQREFRLILAGSRPRQLGVCTGRELPAQLERHWQAADYTGDLVAALALTRKLEQPGAERRIYTDHLGAAASPTPGTTWRALGRSRENFAVTGALRDSGRALFLVANLSPREREVTLRAAGERRTLQIPAHGVAKAQFTLPPGTGELTARLPPDELAFDQQLTLLPEDSPPVRVRLELPESCRRPVAEALAATGRAHLVETEPELLITTAPPTGTPRQFTVLLTPGSGRTLAGEAEAVRRSELLTGLDWHGVLWSEPRAPLRGRPLWRLNDRTLAAERRNLVEIVWSPESSNWQRTPAWPGWWVNLLEQVTARRPGPRRSNYRSGEPVVVQLPPECPELRIQSAGRPEYRLRPDPEQRVRIENLPPGRTHLRAGDLTWELMVNPLNDTESDLSRAGSGEQSAPPAAPVGPIPGRRELLTPLLLALLGLLGLHHWRLYRRSEQ